MLVCPCADVEQARLVQKYLWFFLDLLCAGAADGPPPRPSGHPLQGKHRVYRLSCGLLEDAQLWQELVDLEDGQHRRPR